MTITALCKRWTRALAMTATALSLVHTAPVSAQSVILPEGMAIPLETRADISSKTARKGDRVELAVARPVTIGGVTVIAAGTPAVGEITRARDNGLLGRSGKLDIQVTSLKTGQFAIPLRGQRDVKGRSGTLGAVGAGIVFLPLAILIRGKDVKVPAGTKFDVYVDQEIRLPSAVSASSDIAGTADSPASSGAIRSIDPNDTLAR
ncbi:hypothetical protein [Sphingobium sp.]|uniref:hypothetical protein n=1 Tax=Sphingobium sp. TaxID=1912891 RepID=UPI0035C69AE0